ncbi:MAG: hypothetical protein ACK4S2_14040 [Gemmobacter sp.]|uniref:hypothetical protein n=1 Tax=Gemmobacter sp. TaxID=1898957 RepID=UPI0039198C0A
MTFIEYLRMPQSWEPEFASFVTDALGDLQLSDLTEWDQLQRYLLRRGQGHAIVAARLVWAGYRAKLRRDRKRKTKAA